MEDCLPPHNLDAEQSVLGGILLGAEEPFGILQPGDFYKDAHNVIYGVMKERWASGGAVDPVSLTEAMGSELKSVGGAYYITGLMDGAISAQSETHARIVRDHSERRSAIYVLSKQIASLYDGCDIKECHAEILSVFDKRDEGGYKEIKESVLTAVERIDKNVSTGGTVGLSTGVRDLDSLTGGMGKNDMIVLAGRPSMGKTALAIFISRHVSKTKDVAIASVESSIDEITERAIFQSARLDYKAYRSGYMPSDGMEKVLTAVNGLNLLSISIDHSGKTIDEIFSRARRLKSRKGLSLLIIDYLQLVGGGRGEKEYSQASDISHRIKGMAKSLDCPVIVLCQLNRMVVHRPSKEPILSDLRDSGKIEEDADQVWMIHRPELCGIDNFEDGSLTDGISQIFVRKHRNGPTGSIKLCFHKTSMGFRDYSPELPF